MSIVSTYIAASKLPAPWVKGIQGGGTKLDSPILSFDCFKSDGGIEIVTRLEDKHLPALGDVQIYVDGTPAPFTLTPIPRGGRISIAAVGNKVTLQAFGSEITLPVGADESGAFEGKNTLLTIALEPTAETLVNWLNFHHYEQGADAALVFLRHGPDFDLAALKDALSEQIAKIKIATLRLIEVQVPLGHPQMPSETSRYLAPDAPGKALLPDPVKDPWRAPVAELAILEVARRRFLPKARAVLYCQPFDLVMRDAQTVFDAADAAGFVKFQGKRAYPYALPGNGPPRHEARKPARDQHHDHDDPCG